MARGELWFGSGKGQATDEPRCRPRHAGAGEAALGVPLLGYQHGPRILEILDVVPPEPSLPDPR